VLSTPVGAKLEAFMSSISCPERVRGALRWSRVNYTVRPDCLRVIPVLGLLAVSLVACSDAETPAPTKAMAATSGSNGPLAPTDLNPGEQTIIDDTPSPGASGVSAGGTQTPNLGTETLCDGMDDNGNGIIDDVDVGKDGLCDCIHIGFFGDVASDAGTATQSFEAWLTSRSGQIPIKHLAATDTLTKEWLADLQVLIVGGLKDREAQAGTNPAFSADELAAFDDWIENQGGGAITLSGYTTNIDDARPASELLTGTGLSYDLASVTGAGVVNMGAPPVWLTDIVAPDHPTVQGVSQIGVYYGYPVVGDGTAILSGDGFTLAMAKQWGAGRVFAFADEWITQDATWTGLTNGQQDPCQQPCDEEMSACMNAMNQCTQCEKQPCSDPNDTDTTTCAKGCQPSCDSETARCTTNTAQCDSCNADVSAREQATPRLWLNIIKWLTPDHECKVDIPANVSVRVR
jgi:hypothetical protein